MSKENNYIVIPDETQEADDYSNDDLYNIESWGADLSFRELITMYDENELLKPELQRNYVWDKNEASRFIESLLLGLPVPSIFLAKQTNEKKLIIDGYQRIMTVYDYVNRKIFSKDGSIFKLSSSKRINERWRGKSFDELSDSEQRKIKSTTIHAIIFQQKEPKDDDTSLYQIFERINTSGRSLTPQEIRNCVYQGPLNTLLIDLNKRPEWRAMYGTKLPDSRMKDTEFILRFFVLSQESIRTSNMASISLKQSLNEYMGESINNQAAEIARMQQDFTQTISFVYDNFGKEAFFNVTLQGKVIRKLHPTIYDAIAIATRQHLKSNKSTPTDLTNRRLKLLKDDDFKEYTTVRTTNLDHITGRIKLAYKYLYGTETDKR